MANIRRGVTGAFVDESRKRVILVAPSILSAWKLAQYDWEAGVCHDVRNSGRRVAPLLSRLESLWILTRCIWLHAHHVNRHRNRTKNMRLHSLTRSGGS
jgi:hypothetical protein